MQDKNKQDVGGQYEKKWPQWLICWTVVGFCEALCQRRLPQIVLEEAIGPQADCDKLCWAYAMLDADANISH